MIERHYSAKDPEDTLGVSQATAYRMMDEAGATRIGGCKHVRESRLRAYLEARTELSLDALCNEVLL